MTYMLAIPQPLVHHEAGHAIMFWFYGIPIEYVSIVPECADGRGTWTKTAVNPPTTGQSDLEKWMRGAEAGEAAAGSCVGSAVPQASALILKFDSAMRKLDQEPLDPDADPKDDDYRNFGVPRSRQRQRDRPGGHQRGDGHGGLGAYLAGSRAPDPRGTLARCTSRG